MQHPSHNTSHMRGLTLIEVMVLLSVTVLLGITINSLIVNFYRTNSYILQQTSAIDSARRGMRISFENLRQAAYGEDGSFPIQSAATSSITFYSDVDGDNSVERIRLSLDGETFYRTITEATGNPPEYTGTTSTSTIATYVRNGTSSPLFRYYDSTGTEISSSTIDVSLIEAITTSIMVDLNPMRAPDIITLQETATLRNLR